jgi:hypothetical protein
MAEESYDDRLQRHQELIEGLARIWQRQGEINEELRTFTQQQVEINADVRTTLARLETLLARLLPPSGNGREA